MHNYQSGKNRIVAGGCALFFAMCATIFLFSCSESETPEDQDIVVDGSFVFLGDDRVDTLYLNGELVNLDAVDLDVNTVVAGGLAEGGQYTVALKVNNSGGWAGGLMAYLENGGNHYVTDGTWKYSFVEVDGYGDADFDDSGWPTADAWGRVDETAGWARDSACSVIGDEEECALWSLNEAGAHFIWSPKTVYFRKEFEANDGDTAWLYVGADGDYTVYLNGVEITNVVGDTDYIAQSLPVDLLENNVLAVTVTSTAPLDRGIGSHFRAAVRRQESPLIAEWWPGAGQYDTIPQYTLLARTNTEWKCSGEFEAGWNGVSFSDAHWLNSDFYEVGPVTGFPALGFGQALTIWTPKIVYMRKTFSLN